MSTRVPAEDGNAVLERLLVTVRLQDAIGNAISTVLKKPYRAEILSLDVDSARASSETVNIHVQLVKDSER